MDLKKKIPTIAIPTSDDYSQWYNENCYIDKTEIISEIQNSLKSGSALFFGRPRRWGKSLFLSTLKHFFGKDFFQENFFSDKQVWKDKKLQEKAGTYFIIHLDLKPLYNRETNTLEMKDLFRQIFQQFKNTINLREEIIDIDGTFFDLQKQ